MLNIVAITIGDINGIGIEILINSWKKNKIKKFILFTDIVKLERFMLSGSFTSTQFYADIEGHPEEEKVKRALDELMFFTSVLKILGVYKRSENALEHYFLKDISIF